MSDHVTGFIDPPDAFAPRWEWEDFVRELEAMPKSPEVDRALALAKEHLASMGEGDPDEDDFSDLED